MLHAWLLANRQKVPDGTATAKAIDCSLKRWAALTRFYNSVRLHSKLGNLPPNAFEQQSAIKHPIAVAEKT